MRRRIRSARNSSTTAYAGTFSVSGRFDERGTRSSMHAVRSERPGMASLTRRSPTSEREVGFHRLFEDVVLEDEFPHLLFQFLDGLFPLALFVSRVRAQGILRGSEEALSPLFDLRHGQPVLPGCLLR